MMRFRFAPSLVLLVVTTAVLGQDDAKAPAMRHKLREQSITLPQPMRTTSGQVLEVATYDLEVTNDGKGQLLLVFLQEGKEIGTTLAELRGFDQSAGSLSKTGVVVCSATPTSIQCNARDTQIQCDARQTEIRCNGRDAKFQCDAHATKISCDEHKTKIQCDARKAEIRCNGRDAKLQRDAHATKIQCDAHTTKIQCNAHTTKLQCDLHATKLQCDAHAKKFQCDAREAQIQRDPNKSNAGEAAITCDLRQASGSEKPQAADATGIVDAAAGQQKSGEEISIITCNFRDASGNSFITCNLRDAGKAGVVACNFRDASGVLLQLGELGFGTKSPVLFDAATGTLSIIAATGDHAGRGSLEATLLPVE